MKDKVYGELTALNRYDNILFRIVRGSVVDRNLDPNDILILSPTLGMVKANERIRHHLPYPNLILDAETTAKKRKQHGIC